MEIKIVRKLDNLGRLVIPKDIRRSLNLNMGDGISIEVRSGSVILTKEEEKTK